MSNSNLFSPLTIRGLTLPNRVMASPMWQYAGERGYPTDWHLMHLGRMASGGTGLVMQEGTVVEKRARGTAGDLGIWDDSYVQPMRRLVDMIRSCGSIPAIQLMHPGRKSRQQRPWEGRGPLEYSPDLWDWDEWELIGPSPIPVADGFPAPREMTLADIQMVIDSFVQAARRADEAGYEVIELHGAHGYLLHQFLSDVSNRRGDAYGGSFENRTRLLLEVTEAVRAVWPDHKPLFMRLSCVDEGTWTMADTIRLTRELMARGIDLIDCSSGGLGGSAVQGVRAAYGYQVPYAAELRRETGVLTAAVGVIVHADQAEAIIGQGEADLVAIGRELLYNPNWTADAAQKLGVLPNFELIPERMGFWLGKRAKAIKDFKPSTFEPA